MQFKEKLILSLMVAAFTATANYFVSTRNVKSELASWRIQFEESGKKDTRDIAHQKFSEILHYHRLSTNDKSYINSAMVEQHFYSATIPLMRYPSDPAAVQMRNAQDVLNLAIAGYQKDLHDNISEYEHRVRFLGRWSEDECAEGLLSIADEQHKKSIVFSEIFEKTAKDFFQEGKTPFDAIEHLSLNVFAKEISFSEEVRIFASEAEKCFGDLIE